MVDAYGLNREDRPGFVDKMVAVAVHWARHEAIEADVRADSTDAVTRRGFPILWALAWKARSASWMLRHRKLLEAALEQ